MTKIKLCGLSRPEDIQAAKEAGMNSHIAKPIDVSKMMETLAEILRG